MKKLFSITINDVYSQKNEFHPVEHNMGDHNRETRGKRGQRRGEKQLFLHFAHHS